MFCQPAYGEEDLRASRLDAKLLQPNFLEYITSSRAAQPMLSLGPIQPPLQQLTNNNNYYCHDEMYICKLSTCQQQQQQASLMQQQWQLQQQREQYWHSLNQRQQLAVASAFQQQVNYAVNNENNKRNEISKSLQMYAAKLSNPCVNNTGEELPRHSDAIRQDFAENGYTNDNFINYKSQQHNNDSYLNNIKQLQQHQQQQQPEANVHFPNWYLDYTFKQQDNVQKNPLSTNENILRPTKRNYKKIPKDLMTKHCVFCENNNEPEAVVKSHTVRDGFGRVLCPKLRNYICPICKASGDVAHTIKYCPKKPIITMEDAIKAEAFRLAKAKNDSLKSFKKGTGFPILL